MPDFDTKEKRFEEDIETYLCTEGGYTKGNPKAFDRRRALDKSTFLLSLIHIFLLRRMHGLIKISLRWDMKFRLRAIFTNMWRQDRLRRSWPRYLTLKRSWKEPWRRCLIYEGDER